MANMPQAERVKNVARDNARVENQIGVIHGDANFYSVSDEPTPEEKFRVGLNYLNGNMPRLAEKMIGEAVIAGFSPIRGSYYWILAILSGRTFDHLSEDEFGELQAASEKAHAASDMPSGIDSKAWLSTLDVLVSLVGSILSQEQDPDADPSRFAAAFHRYEQLPADRRDEIRRHLDMILIGGIQDQLASQDAAEIAERRMSNDRENRVWRFFLPDPVAPRKHSLEGPSFRLSDVLMLTAGAIITAGSGYTAARILLPSGATMLILGVLLLCVVGGVLDARFGSEWLAMSSNLRWQESQLRRPDRPPFPEERHRPDEHQPEKLDFPGGVNKLVDLYFDHWTPDDVREAARWRRESEGRRESLKHEIVRQYNGAHPASANAGEWLVRWHVHKFHTSWNAGEIYKFRSDLKIPIVIWARCVASVLLLTAAWLLTFVELVATGGSAGFRTGLLLGAGLALGLTGMVRTALTGSQRRLAAEEFQTRFTNEQNEYDLLRHDLLSMPSDAEMAAWLDYDKSHIKTLALKGYCLANRDTIAHVVLTEAPPRCRRARVLYGPPRYSKYDVRIFLLTSTGVRQFTVRLDLMTGVISNEHRSAFRYDAISSAEVMEVGVRMNGAKRRIVEPDEDDDEDGRNGDADDKDKSGSGKLTFAQAFKLTLNNTQTTHVLVENFDEGLVDKVREDSKYLSELARDTSGVSAALRILEAVAAEGREWVAQERTRRRRRLESYERSRFAGPCAIGSGDGAGAARRAIDGGNAGEGNNVSMEPSAGSELGTGPRGVSGSSGVAGQDEWNIPDGPGGSKGFWL